MTVYLLCEPTIANVDTYRAYAEQWIALSDTAREHGGKILVRGGRTETLIGDWARVVPLLVEFPDEAALKSWTGSQEFAEMVSVVTRSANLRAVQLRAED